jgi:hypothetical protein
MANAADGGTGPYAGPLWERYLDVVERELAIDRTRLVPNASFVGDLGVS